LLAFRKRCHPYTTASLFCSQWEGLLCSIEGLRELPKQSAETQRVALCLTRTRQAREFQVRTGIRCKVDLPAEDFALDQARLTPAFRILQEALANVARHSGATRVDISLRADTDHFILKIVDNGRGVTAADLRNPKSLGLLAILERAFLLGATLTSREKTARERRSPFQSRIGSGPSRNLRPIARAHAGTGERVPHVPKMREVVER